MPHGCIIFENTITRTGWKIRSKTQRSPLSCAKSNPILGSIGATAAFKSPEPLRSDIPYQSWKHERSSSRTLRMRSSKRLGLQRNSFRQAAHGGPEDL